jgi:hypothetical protein
LLGAALLSAFCAWFSWRALRRCREIQSATALADDALEQNLVEREQNLAFNLAKRNVQALGRTALFGGTGLAFFALTGGREYDLVAGEAFGVGFAGWTICAELQRRVGSLADMWRSETNRRRRRQGVDHPERTG